MLIARARNMVSRADGRAYNYLPSPEFFTEVVDALEAAQQAPAVVDRDKLIRDLNARYGVGNGTHFWIEMQTSAQALADFVLDSGVLRDVAEERAKVREECAWIAEHPTWHPLGRLNDTEHSVVVRVAAAIREGRA